MVGNPFLLFGVGLKGNQMEDNHFLGVPNLIYIYIYIYILEACRLILRQMPPVVGDSNQGYCEY